MRFRITDSAMMAGSRARVVIVGAGFGGLECARELDRAEVDVLLLDRGGYHLFTPLLYQVATALLNPSEVAYPLRAMFRKSPNVRVWATTVTGVDFSRRVVHVSPGEEIAYDYLVLATGSANDYHGNEQLEDAQVVLVQSASRLLTAFSQRLGRYAERTLTSRGVDVRTRTHITAADGHRVTLSDGSVVSARTVVWAGGVAPLVPGTQPEPQTTRGGRVRVDEFLRIPGAQRAYALGDAAAAGQGGHELPMVSAPAIQAGRYIARAIRSDLRGQAGPPFRYFDKGRMATIGRNAAVAQLRGGLELTGFAGWLAWLSVHVWYLAGLRNRVITLASWAWYYLRLDRPIRIIVQTPPDPIVATLRTPDPDEERAETRDGGRAR
jgi:NADH dehydrogenase FAD-containing subunit